jgi:sirohydrochlorin cobaltochelatase
MTNSCLILLAHGSKNPQWAKPFEKLVCELKHEVGDGKVFLCFMENAEPSMHQVAKGLAENGTRHLRILPLFMATGNHLQQDIPAQVAAVRTELPELTVELLPPVGEHPLFLELMHKLARESASTLLDD